jgi:hypothetical protein
MALDEKAIRARLLGTRVSAPIAPGSEWVKSLFEDRVRSVLATLNVEATLVEVHTPSRVTTCKTIDGRQYVVFDHSFLRSMRVLDRLVNETAPAFLTAAALQQILAEAARTTGRADIYAFFVRRAEEAKKAFLAALDGDTDPDAETAQCLLVLLHEAGHSLPSDQELHAAASQYAALKISSVSTQWIRMLSAQFAEALGMELPNIPKEQLEEWINFRDGLQVNDEQLGEAIHAVAGDSSFHAEIACDRVALVLQQAILEGHRDVKNRDAYLLLAEKVLLATYSAFLHLRFLKYVDDIFLHLPQHVLTEKINTLDLRSMMSSGFRGTLVGQLVLDIAGEMGGAGFAERIRILMRDLQTQHTDVLFPALNELLESTILNVEFHQELSSMLAHDGVTAVERGGNLRESLYGSDSIWLAMAKG